MMETETRGKSTKHKTGAEKTAKVLVAGILPTERESLRYDHLSKLLKIFSLTLWIGTNDTGPHFKWGSACTWAEPGPLIFLGECVAS